MTHTRSISLKIFNRIAVVFGAVSLVLLWFSFDGKFWSDDSSMEAGAYHAAVDKFVSRLLDKQNPAATTYAFSRQDDCDVRHEGKYHIVMGTVTVSDFGGNDRPRDFICALFFDPATKRWSEVGTRVFDQ